MTGLVFVIRWSGWLEPYELNAYDHLMQVQWKNRPEPTDDKLLLVIHDGNEPLPNIQNMEFRGTQSIPDEAFDLAAKKLYEKFSPLAIGFMNVQPDSTDNYISEEEYPELVSRLKDEDGNLFTVCQMPTDGNAGKGSILNSNRNHVGLANFLDDNTSGNKLLRRQLISNNNNAASECTSKFSISALISFFYSQEIKSIDIQQTENKNIDDRQLQFAARLLPRLTNEAGGYSRSIDANGSYQLLLNYRRTEDLERPTDIISLSQLLDDEIDSERIKTYQDRIVLIGSTVPTDPHVTVHATPYKNSRGERIEIPGLIANAHMISQLVHWIDGDRPLIKWWQVWQESFWILLWASIGGMSVLKPFKPFYISIFSVLAITGLSLLCNYAMKYGWWIPIVPPAIALLGTPILSVYLSVRYLRRSWQE
jgi:CHASE2 domain-containing sensor protein